MLRSARLKNAPSGPSGPAHGNRPVETVLPEEEPARAQGAGKATGAGLGQPPGTGGVALGLNAHVPCGLLRGNTEWGEQGCSCSPSPKWEGADVSELRQLCASCLSAPAGGPSRWAVVVCRRCWQENRARYHLPLARHSLANSMVLGDAADHEQVERFQRGILDMFDVQKRLAEWRRVHLVRLLGLAGLEGVEEIPEDLVHLLARQHLPAPEEAILNVAAWLREGGPIPMGW